MDFKKLSRWEVVGIVFSISIFVFLSLVVIFKSEWLDSFFYGPPVEEQEFDFEEIFNNAEEVEVEGSEWSLEELPYANLDVVAEDGQALVFLEIDDESSLTGIEFFFEKDGTLEISDFVCEEPFECILFETEGDEVSIVAVVPPTLVDSGFVGEVLIGNFTYSGSGNLYLNSSSNSFVSILENPEFNILNLTDSVFLLD